MSSVVERFLRYVKIETTSDNESNTWPTTPWQLDLSRLLVDELHELGILDAHLDENCYVMATLPSNVDYPVPVIGWIAHVDTSKSFSGKNVNPQIVPNYSGEDIPLDSSKGIVLSPRQFPALNNYIGQTLITTDGSTLLGADDKAGVAEIMAALEILIRNPEIPHGTLKICFTPDEETTRSVDRFDVPSFGADFAYTLDGGPVGELQYENFNATKITVHVQGVNVHPGSAKDLMVNALAVAMELDALLPEQQRPQYTEGYEGFFHLDKMSGTVESAKMEYLIRDHDAQKFEVKKAVFQAAVDYVNHKFGSNTIKLTWEDQYRNMKELILPVWHVVETAKEAMLALGIQPINAPIRGGTDGAKLTYKGLPTPNLFAGGENFHGKYEFVSTEAMEKAVEMILKIIELYTVKK